MKRLSIVCCFVLVLAALTLPAVARADDDFGFAPAGWTWDES